MNCPHCNRSVSIGYHANGDELALDDPAELRYVPTLDQDAEIRWTLRPTRTEHDCSKVIAAPVCPNCNGDGEVTFNPSRSYPKDPQMEDSARCPLCHGAGVLIPEKTT